LNATHKGQVSSFLGSDQRLPFSEPEEQPEDQSVKQLDNMPVSRFLIMVVSATVLALCGLVIHRLLIFGRHSRRREHAEEKDWSLDAAVHEDETDGGGNSDDEQELGMESSLLLKNCTGPQKVCQEYD
jgi:flagellar biosynthesis/type III secretory pathway M-ring protein FliF/YscJ